MAGELQKTEQTVKLQHDKGFNIQYLKWKIPFLIAKMSLLVSLASPPSKKTKLQKSLYFVGGNEV